MYSAKKQAVFLLGTALVFGLAGCSNDEQAQDAASSTNESTQSGSTIADAEGDLNITITPASEDAQDMTPILAQVPYAPIPFAGSDGRTHLVYELQATNFSRGKTTIGQLEVLDADTGDVVDTLDAKEVASSLHPAGSQDTADTLDPSMAATIFLNVTFDDPDQVPNRLAHRLSVQAAAAPPDQQQLTEKKVGETNVEHRNVVMFGPPLKGSNYLAADSCCDAPHIHRRSPLPINGQFTLAQRYAVDYEQLDADNRIYSGDKADLNSYTIYGKEALAVADGTVVKVTDGYPEQNPGDFPKGISLDEADGNSVILDIGGGNYVLYGHFQPGSIRVKEGDRVKQGDVLALVGSSGNSLAPHLHFHVMDSSQSLASNGLPYGLDSFTLTGQSAGTDAFNKAEADGTPLEVTPVDPAKTVTKVMPLDQSEVSFD